MISFFLPVEPGVKGNSKRIVTRGRGGRPFVIGRDADRQAERMVALLASRFRPTYPLEGPVRLDVTFVVPIPPSWSRRRQEQALSGAILPASKPDRGNYLKLLEDALQAAGFYRDDAQVVAGEVGKRYGQRPGYVVHIGPFDVRREHETPPDAATPEGA